MKKKLRIPFNESTLAKKKMKKKMFLTLSHFYFLPYKIEFPTTILFVFC